MCKFCKITKIQRFILKFYGPLLLDAWLWRKGLSLLGWFGKALHEGVSIPSQPGRDASWSRRLAFHSLTWWKLFMTWKSVDINGEDNNDWKKKKKSLRMKAGIVKDNTGKSHSQNNAGQLQSREHPAFWGRVECRAPHWGPKQQHNYKIREQYWAE